MSQEVRLPAPVRAAAVSDIDADGVPAGAFEFVSGYKVTVEGRALRRQDGPPELPAGMFYQCPCGCGTQGYLRLRPAEPGHPSWEWDGNREAPTLSPSVHHVGHWHGYLRSGIWEQA